MERKPHGLSLLFEGLPATVIHSQVLARLHWLETAGIASHDILSFAPARALFEESVTRLAGVAGAIAGRIDVRRGCKPALPGSRYWHRRQLAQWLARAPGRYRFIHARSDYAAAVAGPLARDLGIPMLWDCRGDVEGEFVERSSTRAPAALIAWRARRCRQDGEIAARTCAAATFVSRPLQARWLALIEGKPSLLLPCIADETTFFFDPVLRAATRARLGYADDHVVVVYSGSLGVYQGFDMLASRFKTIAQRNRKARLLVLTPSPLRARALLADIDPALITVAAVPFAEVNAYLNAGDIGALLRPASRTNTAAFPTKFAEYGLAGLDVLLSPTIPDCHEMAERAGNLVSPDDDLTAFRHLSRRRTAIMMHARGSLTHEALRQPSHQLYRQFANAATTTS